MKTRYRVWIVRYKGDPPPALGGIPASAFAVAPAERGTMTVRNARRYVEAFNRAALRGTGKVWAVALPVTVRYQGEPRPGEAIAG